MTKKSILQKIFTNIGKYCLAIIFIIASYILYSRVEAAQKSCDTPNKLCGNELLIFDYDGNNVMGWVPDYSKKYPKKPRWLLFVDPNEALQKMYAGFQVDIIHLTNTDRLYWMSFLQPWDVKKITSWNDIYPFWKNAPGFQPVKGKVYLIPTLFGLTGATYDTNHIKPGEIKSLKDFANPKYRGRIAMPDGAYEAYGFCMLAMGNKKPFVEMTKKDVDDCGQFLRMVTRNIRGYFADSASIAAAFQTGEIWLAYTWVDVAYNTNRDRLKNPATKNNLLKFDRDIGFSIWAQGMARARTSKPEVDDLAYDYVNALDKDGADYLVHEFGYGSANKKAMEALVAKEPNVLKDRYLDNIDSYVAANKVLIFGGLPVETSRYLLAEWERIKIGR